MMRIEQVEVDGVRYLCLGLTDGAGEVVDIADILLIEDATRRLERDEYQRAAREFWRVVNDDE